MYRIELKIYEWHTSAQITEPDIPDISLPIPSYICQVVLLKSILNISQFFLIRPVLVEHLTIYPIRYITNNTSLFMNADVLYAWENPEYKVVEDSQSLALNLCLVSESGTLTFPVDISVTSTAISATGMNKYSRL